jgi:hypothetical protein
MITCYPVWTAARPIVRHIARRIAHHAIHHPVMGAISIVCVAVPAWLVVPSPAAVPVGPLGDMPPVMMPWPGDDVAPGGWGGYAPGVEMPAVPPGAEMPALPPSSVPGVEMPVWTGSAVTLPSQAIDTARSDVLHLPVPEPAGVWVFCVGLVVVVWLRRRRA